jgi:hypothetical protein
MPGNVVRSKAQCRPLTRNLLHRYRHQNLPDSLRNLRAILLRACILIQ